VDDEEGIRDIIKEYLGYEEFTIIEAGDGIEALSKFKVENPDLIVLDIMLPKLDGWAVCRKIREESKVPIIMLSARGEEYDKLFGFEQGIDDYMVKPFSPKELVARIKAVFNRVVQSEIKKDIDETESIDIGNIVIDIKGRSVFRDKKEINMTPKEYDLFLFFVQNQGRAFSREQLLNQVWGYEFLGDVRTVDTHVKMLRESLKEDRGWIKTVWGMGYKFQMEE
jgi:DNA-binding response OmpR family regulator